MRRIHDENAPDPRRILVVLPTWVGDVVMATPTLAALRRRFADAHIAYLIRPGVRDLIEGSPWMDDIIAWPNRDRRGRQPGTLRLGIQLRRHAFDWAILLTNSFRSALVTRMGRVPRRIGYERDGRGWMLTDRLRVEREGGRIVKSRMVDYYGRLAWAVGCERPGDRLQLHVSAPDAAAIEKRFASEGLTGDRPVVVMTPGASFGPSKCWMPERFAAVCDRLVERDNARIVVTYAPAEESLARKAIAAMEHPPTVMDNPRITLGQLKAVIQRSDLLLCNDTGPRHFAKAFDKPVVTVFGPTCPEWTETDYSMERKVRIDVDCGPCQKPVCPHGHHQCMTGVTVDMVYAACADVLSHRSAARSVAS